MSEAESNKESEKESVKGNETDYEEFENKINKDAQVITLLDDLLKDFNSLTEENKRLHNSLNSTYYRDLSNISILKEDSELLNKSFIGVKSSKNTSSTPFKRLSIKLDRSAVSRHFNSFNKRKSLSIEKLDCSTYKESFSTPLETKPDINNIYKSTPNLSFKLELKPHIMAFDSNKFFKTIPEYNGNEENLNHFLACCDQYHDSLPDAANKKIFLDSLVRKLTGRAFNFYNREAWLDWAALKGALKKYFSSSQSFESLQLELGKIKQNLSSVREYGEKIEKILLELNKVCNEVRVENETGEKFFKIQNEKLAIKAFVNGLEEPLRTILRSRKFETIRAAITDAIEIETEEKLHKMNNLSINEINKTEKTVNADVVPASNGNSNMLNSNNNQNRIIFCTKCGKTGHYANNCYTFFNRQFGFNNGMNHNNFRFNNRFNTQNGHRPNYFSQNQNQMQRQFNFNQNQRNPNFQYFNNQSQFSGNFNPNRYFNQNYVPNRQSNHVNQNNGNFNQNNGNFNQGNGNFNQGNGNFNQNSNGNYQNQSLNQNNQRSVNFNDNQQRPFNSNQNRNNNQNQNRNMNQNPSIRTCENSKNSFVPTTSMDTVALAYFLN